MALKMENYHKKTALTAAKQLISPTKVYINRYGRAVTFKIAPLSKKKNEEKLLKDNEDDIQSIRGK